MRSIQPRPIVNPLQGFAQLAQAGLGAAMQVRGEQQAQQQAEARQRAIQQILSGQTSPGTMTAGLPQGQISGGQAMSGTVVPAGPQGQAINAPSQLAQLLSGPAGQDPMIQQLALSVAMRQPQAGQIKQIRQGDDFVTVRVDSSGQMTEISRSPIAASRPQTTINLPGQKAQTKFEETIAKSAADLATNVQQAGESAQVVDNSLDMFEQAMGAAQGGGLADFKLGAGRVIQSLGLDPGDFGIDNVASLEAANAISNRLALAQVEQMKGALSNKELAFLQSQIPQISNTPEGRAKLIQTLRAANRRAQERADFVTNWLVENEGVKGPGFIKALRDYDKGQPALSDEIASRQASDPLGIRG